MAGLTAVLAISFIIFVQPAGYVSRPPVASERMTLAASGHVRDTLKTPYRDGTTHVVLEPLDLIACLAALVPPAQSRLL